MEKVDIIRTMKFDIFYFKEREDGILHFHAYGEEPLNLASYKNLVKVIGEVSGGKRALLLFTADEFQVPDEEVRKLIAKADSNPYSLASACVASSLPQKLIGNFFLTVLKPERPVRIFTSVEDALDWLKSYKE